MNTTLKTFLVFIYLFISSCSLNQSCPENINNLPLFGSVKKCPSQIEADNIFLSECDKAFKNRNEAAKYYIEKGWDFFYKKQFDTSIRRFNQAWLLDTTNADIYWGLGNVLGASNKFEESMGFFKKSIQLNPNNAKVYECASTSLGNLFYKTKNVDQLKNCIDYLKKAISLDPNNAHYYANLTAAYSYFTQKDSAKKYLIITDNMDSTAINPEVRQLLK